MNTTYATPRLSGEMDAVRAAACDAAIAYDGGRAATISRANGELRRARAAFRRAHPAYDLEY